MLCRCVPAMLALLTTVLLTRRLLRACGAVRAGGVCRLCVAGKTIAVLLMLRVVIIVPSNPQLRVAGAG